MARYHSWSDDNQFKSSVCRRRLRNYQRGVMAQQKEKEDAAKQLADELRKLDW